VKSKINTTSGSGAFAVSSALRCPLAWTPGALFAILWLLAAGLATAETPPPAPGGGGQEIGALLERGHEQYNTALREGTEAAFQKAEDLFDEAVGKDPGSAPALAWRGVARLARARVVSALGDFARTSKLSNLGTADLDKSVTMGPESVEVRQLRGLAYASMPAFLRLDATARGDLDFVTGSKEFEAGSGEARAHLLLTLGLVAERMYDPATAAASWRKAVEAAPDSEWGKDARKRLKALARPAPATAP